MASNCERDVEHCLVIFLEGSVPIKERCLGGKKTGRPGVPSRQASRRQMTESFSTLRSTWSGAGLRFFPSLTPG